MRCSLGTSGIGWRNLPRVGGVVFILLAGVDRAFCQPIEPLAASSWRAHSASSGFPPAGLIEIGGAARRGPAWRSQSDPLICHGAGQCLVTWRETQWRRGHKQPATLRVTRLSSDGAPMDSSARASFPAPNFAIQPSMSALLFDGAAYHLVWTGETGNRVARLDSEGRSIDAEPRELPLGDAVERVGPDYYVAMASGYLSCMGDDPPVCVPEGGVTVTRVGIASGVPIDTIQVRSNVVARDAAIARGASNFLVVWREDSGGQVIRGARVSYQGVVLDPASILIGRGNFDCGYPTARYRDGRYLVVWEEGFANAGGWLRTARVAEIDGALEPLNLADPPRPLEGEYAMAAGEEQVLLAWRGYPQEGLYARRVSWSGTWLDPEPLRLAANSPMGRIAATAVADGYVVAWAENGSDGSNVYAARLTAAGQVSPAGCRLLSRGPNAQLEADAAFDGAHHLVAWVDRDALQPRIRATRVTPDGSVLDSDGLSLSGAGSHFAPSVSTSEEGSVVTWVTDPRWGFGSASMARVGRNGDVTPLAPLAIGADPRAPPRVASIGRRSIAVWTGAAITPEGARVGTFFARLDPDGAPSETTLVDTVVAPLAHPLSGTYENGQSPAIAVAADHWLVACVDHAGGNLDLVIARVDTSATAPDPQPLALAHRSGDETSPAIACANDRCLVVWRECREEGCVLYAARVDENGAPMDAEGFPLAADVDSETKPDVVFDGSAFVVSWDGWRDADIESWFAVVSSAGAVVHRERILAAGAMCEAPRLSRGPANQVLAVFHFDDPDLGVPRIGARFLSGEPVALAPGIGAGFPNPFAASTELVFSLPVTQEVRIEVFDLAGRRVKTLHSGEHRQGTHRVRWDGRDDSGARVGAGVYFVRLRSSTVESSRRLVRLE